VCSSEGPLLAVTDGTLCLLRRAGTRAGLRALGASTEQVNSLLNAHSPPSRRRALLDTAPVLFRTGNWFGGFDVVQSPGSRRNVSWFHLPFEVTRCRSFYLVRRCRRPNAFDISYLECLEPPAGSCLTVGRGWAPGVPVGRGAPEPGRSSSVMTDIRPADGLDRHFVRAAYRARWAFCMLCAR